MLIGKALKHDRYVKNVIDVKQCIKYVTYFYICRNNIVDISICIVSKKGGFSTFQRIRRLMY